MTERTLADMLALQAAVKDLQAEVVRLSGVCDTLIDKALTARQNDAEHLGTEMRLEGEMQDVRDRLAVIEKQLGIKPTPRNLRLEQGTECLWTYDSISDKWDTTCGNAFCFNNDEDPAGNGMRYCPYCGGKLVEEEYTDG